MPKTFKKVGTKLQVCPYSYQACNRPSDCPQAETIRAIQDIGEWKKVCEKTLQCEFAGFGLNPREYEVKSQMTVS